MSFETLTIRYGAVRGVVDDGVLSVYNVAYASPPVGPLRFSAAVPPTPWHEVRDGRSPGLIAPQPPSGIGSYVPGDPTEQGEDCLTLNLFTPLGPGPRRPVIVFLHGGAFATGSGAGVMYDGAVLARQGVIVVTVNYRLGALGFLSHPALAEPGSALSGNWALSDVIAALRFVRGHAEEIGGDPDNVTLVGQSSGAMLVADLLGSPAARGLFSRAILESGAVLVDSAGHAARRAEEFVSLLGLRGVDRAELARVPAAELVAAQTALADSLGGLLSMPFRPVVEPGVLPRHPFAAIGAGAAEGMELLIGTNRDEFALFTLDLGEHSIAGEEGLTRLTDRLFESIAPQLRGQAGDFVERYGARSADRDVRPPEKPLFDAIATDGVFRVPALRLAEAHSRHGRVFSYRFDWPSPFMNGALGACHGIELPFVFGTFLNPVIAMFAGSGPEVAGLAEAVQGAWARFASVGDPSGGRVGHWPEYLPGRCTMLLGPSVGIAAAPDEPERQLWETRLPQFVDSEASREG